MDQYAVMGNPIQHSKSPLIHSLFAQATAQTLNYDPILVAEDGFVAAVEKFRQEGGLGLNITVPFKEQAWQLADCRTQRAELAGAVNTLSFKNNKIYADNTDGLGLVADMLQNHQGQITGKRILLVGAGGAVRGVLAPILAQQPEQVVVVNRTVSKALALADLFSDLGNISACGFDGIQGVSFDWVINGTSTSLHGELPALPGSVIGSSTWCYDMMYSPQQTRFNEWALSQGAAKVMDGLGMLVEQAAEAFSIWRGVRPETGAVINALQVPAA